MRHYWAVLAAATVLLANALAIGDDLKPESTPGDSPGAKTAGSAAGKKGSSLDDELLEKLDGSGEGLPAAKSGAADVKKPAKSEEAAPAPKRPSKPSTDDELLKEIDAQDDPAVGPKQEKGGEDLGKKADPLTRIGTKMRHAVTLIDREKLSDKTTLLQDEIVQDIDALIKEQKKKMKQQQQSSSQSQQKQKSQRSNVKPQGQKASQQPRQGDGGEQPQPKDPNQESTDRLGKNEQKAPQLDPAAQEELLKRVWGLLPEKDREQMRQAAGDEFLPEYESLIIQYFQRLAEEDNGQP